VQRDIFEISGDSPESNTAGRNLMSINDLHKLLREWLLGIRV